MELAPFGVSVITVVTGGVKSNIARTRRVLVDGSLYSGVETDYLRRQTHSQEVGMEREEYAREVVDKILKGDGWLWKRRIIWAGGNAALVGYLWMVFGVGSGFWDWIMSRMFGLGGLSRMDWEKKQV